MGAETYEPLDTPYLRDVLTRVLRPIVDRYFRPRLIGAGKLPAAGPLVLAVNHSGTAFPYDAIVLDASLWRRDNLEPSRKFRSMFEKELAMTWWMRPFGLDNFWRRAGAVDQTFDNFDRLLARGDRVIYYPEGVPGIGKGFQRRYRLQPFKTSFVVLAARNRAPVYPVSIVNGEWIMPFNFTWPVLDRLMQWCFRVPFLPLPLGAILPLLLPFTWYLAFPARLVIVIGEPIDMAARLSAAGVTDYSRVDRAVAQAVAEQVRVEMQAELTRHVDRCGRWPYHWRGLRRRLTHGEGRLRMVLPFGWAPAFVRHDRDRRRPPARNRLHRVVRDWDVIGFFLPVIGWPVLALTRRLRKPPCGYRGLSRGARREREGAFHWHLKDRPMPSRESEFGEPRGETCGDPTARRAAPRAGPAGGRAFA